MVSSTEYELKTYGSYSLCFLLVTPSIKLSPPSQFGESAAHFCGAVYYSLSTTFSSTYMLIKISQVTAWLGVSSGSFLLMLRGIAIWGRDRRVVILNGFFWLVDLAASFYVLMLRIAQGHSEWSPLLRSCVVTSTDEYKWSLLMRLIADFVLLGTMILGVLRKRDPTRLWDMLYFQGLFWISAALLSEVPDVIMPFMNINDPWNLMFQYPHRLSHLPGPIENSFNTRQSKAACHFSQSQHDTN
ncbi:hypothetical protein BGW80DRAFT_1252062 [Lactifluus volemus]|nr:hypothetical protein BGW80DRAFT_1252062 [Lactifluus volemus]